MGSYYGAGEHQKLAPVLINSININLGIGIAIAFVFILFPHRLFGLLTNHTEAITVINHQVFWLLPLFISMSLTYVLEGYFIGLTKSMIVLKSKVISVVVGFLPMVLIGWQLHSSNLLWLAFVSYLAIRAIFLSKILQEDSQQIYVFDN